MNRPELWKRTKFHLTQLRNDELRAELEFLLYQQIWTLQEIKVFYGLVHYLVFRQELESKLPKLHDWIHQFVDLLKSQ